MKTKRGKKITLDKDPDKPRSNNFPEPDAESAERHRKLVDIEEQRRLKSEIAEVWEAL